MRTEHAFVPKRELVDEFRGLDMRALTSLLYNAERTTTINARSMGPSSSGAESHSSVRIVSEGKERWVVWYA